MQQNMREGMNTNDITMVMKHRVLNINDKRSARRNNCTAQCDNDKH